MELCPGPHWGLHPQASTVKSKHIVRLHSAHVSWPASYPVTCQVFFSRSVTTSSPWNEPVTGVLAWRVWRVQIDRRDEAFARVISRYKHSEARTIPPACTSIIASTFCRPTSQATVFYASLNGLTFKNCKATIDFLPGSRGNSGRWWNVCRVMQLG